MFTVLYMVIIIHTTYAHFDIVALGLEKNFPQAKNKWHGFKIINDISNLPLIHERTGQFCKQAEIPNVLQHIIFLGDEHKTQCRG